ncbi:sulfite oxidase heme-binding subunit YedZ [Parazoarcus communis]|uniref:Protein-methionine-sulfoxide reductase heme-binding subunit MsrQ n=1 Tax=Parazoarcus communis SWub3 = DSM 12120 TaxID=1121029 RepID=A0A323UYN2_9RHOO|nr:protein-methionine-sulfoxide reductase heme-binding subunit MsrQ [Parazoarcus communis]NMG68891.1 sulfoxide reductase heme-binding subunit YedZ [Parazoarcus communis SWub3 = DSM 12120]PZA16770.1 sulfoxide reductase heme-binding subunit YedZ [Azoarcus communis] [Parazoarcus communis SWub3 = DSM 12120]
MSRALQHPSADQIGAIKAFVFFLCMLPAAQLILGWRADSLGANPVETITHATGAWTLRLLLITLAVTPLRRYTGLHWLVRLRRMLGLFAFAYGMAHFGIYLWLDHFFDWQAIANDILKRPYITVGFAALMLMVPLALTSNAAAIKRMGGRRWQALHRSVYAIAVFGVLHYWWLVKADILQPLIYSAVLAVLLGLRAWWRELERRRQLAAPPPVAPSLKGKVIRIVPK